MRTNRPNFDPTNKLYQARDSQRLIINPLSFDYRGIKEGR